MRTLLANRPLLKRKLIDRGNHIRGASSVWLARGPGEPGKFEDCIRELIDHADYVFVGIESLGHADSDHRCRGLNTC